MEQAVELAREVHEDRPEEIERLTRVSGAVREQGATTEAVAVAWLHDLVNDTDVTLDELREMGFGEAIVDSVEVLTRREGESLEDHLARVREDGTARMVKRAALSDAADSAPSDRRSLELLENAEA